MKPFLPVLAYQKVGRPAARSSLKNEWISFRSLEKTISFLLKRGYTFITPLDLPKKLPAKPVLLTFIGGYQSFYTDVFPLLQKYRVRATVFVATDTLGTYNSWQNPYEEPWQNILTATQLQTLVKSGLVQVGTLGLKGNHLLTYQSPDMAREELLESIYRLKMRHHITACAVGFWPGTKDKNLARTSEICAGLNLPVITSVYGKNMLTESQFLRVLKPGWTHLWPFGI